MITFYIIFFTKRQDLWVINTLYDLKNKGS